MADINVEMLKEKLYPAAKALFIIGETLVDVSKSHISKEVAIEKIRDCMYDTDVIGSRYRVDKLIEDCMTLQVYNIFNDEPDHWLKTCIEDKPDFRKYMYYVANIEDLKSNNDNADRITQAVERTRKYIKE